MENGEKEELFVIRYLLFVIQFVICYLLICITYYIHIT
jgi:hypothetical protein